MEKKLQVVLFIFISILTLGVLLVVFYAPKISKPEISTFLRKSITSPTPTASPTSTTSLTSTNFAVIIQTEQCIPKYLLTKEYFENYTICNCHVYVISYQKRCTENLTSSFSHVEHIYNKSVGWSAGRNIGLFKARRRNNYLYYIFMDDDIHLVYNQFTPKEFVDKKIPPFQIFSDFLLDYRPAGVATDYDHWNGVEHMLKKWHTFCRKFHTSRVLTVGHIDPCFNAFHRNTYGTALPYTEKYDDTSFWLSGIQLSMVFKIAFHGQLVYFPEIKAANPKHRPYKMGHLLDANIRPEMAEHLRQRAPRQFRNHSIFQRSHHFNPFSGVNTLCIEPLPPRSPIVPYRIMDHD